MAEPWEQRRARVISMNARSHGRRCCRVLEIQLPQRRANRHPTARMAERDGTEEGEALIAKPAGATLELASTSLAAPPGSRPASAPPGRAVGDRIGRYEIEAELGAGGMGIVYAAIDTVLGRRVALKLVRPGSGGAVAGARLLREAQSLARLSHPNVVSVFDVGTAGDEVYIAIELVDGVSLGAWAAAAPRTPAQILDAMRAAGRGLAAAHAADVVHRDFKPDNVLVGKDGVVRVSDFGLARAVDDGDDDAPVPAQVLTTALTRTGAVIGTPAYMAPEQIDGAAVSAAADQFSYCVALFELLFGARPFAGDSVGALRAVIAAQAIAVHPPVRLPARVLAAIRRGLREDPAARHPSMQALLDELRPPGSRRWVVAAVVAGVVVGGGAMAWSASRQADDPCRTGDAELAAAWIPAARAAAVARVAGLGAYGQTLAPRIDEQLRDHAARWTAGHRDACLASHRGTQTGALVDLRMACLARGRAALTEVARIVETADAKALPEVALAVRALTDPGACADLDALVTGVAPPPPPLAAPVATLGDRLERVNVQLAAGRFAGARTEARAIAAEARPLGYRPLLAEALLAEGHAALMMNQHTEAEPPLTEAVSIAFAVGADAIGVEAWARRAYVQRYKLGLSALGGLDVVEAMAIRRPAARFARALLHNNVGAVEDMAKHRERAAARYERAIAEARGVTGPGAIELAMIRTNLALLTSDPVRRDAVFAEVDAELSRLVGADHPRTLLTRWLRATMQVSAPVAADLLAATCGRHELHDAGSLAAQCWTELGFAAGELHDDARAADAFRRAVEAGGAVVPWAAPYLALFRGDAPGAIRQFEAALAAQPPPRTDAWWELAARADLELGLGRARRAAGDLRAARPVLTSSVAALTAVVRDRPLPQLERRLARGRAELAMVLASSGGDPSEIRELAGLARAWLGQAGAPRDELARLEQLAR
jgi:tRNA A-37 threonylcarbamoyl transferase component Bud32